MFALAIHSVAQSCSVFRFLEDMSHEASKERQQAAHGAGAGEQKERRAPRVERGAVKQFRPGQEDRFRGMEGPPREKSNKLPLFVCIACCCLCICCTAYLYNSFKKAFA